MSDSKQVYKDQQHGLQQHKHNALGKLQAQRLQRVEQRLFGQQQGSELSEQHGQLATSLSVQPTCTQQRQASHTGNLVEPACQQTQTQQHRLAVVQQCRAGSTTQPVRSNMPSSRCMTTTAGRGMQNRPPSRTGSVRSPLNTHQGTKMLSAAASLVVTSSAPSAAAGVAAVGYQPRQLQLACSTAADRSLQQVGNMQLQVHGCRVTVLQQEQDKQLAVYCNKSAAHRQQGIRHQLQHKQDVQGLQQMMARARKASPTVPGLLLMGCGVSWSQLSAQAALVAKRTLHHTTQEKRQLRLHLAAIVMQQWAWFMHFRQQLRRAMQFCNRRLLLAGWQSLRQEVSQQQLLICQANLQAAKYSFLLLSRCFVAWQQQLLTRKRLAATAAAIQQRRDKQVQSTAMLGWQQMVVRGRAQRQLLLRSEAYRVLMMMSRTLQAWRGWITDKQLQRLKETRAIQHWDAVVQHRVLACWQQRVARSAAKWHQLAQALCFHKRRLLTTALQSWQTAAALQRQARAHGVEQLQQWQQQALKQCTAQALCCWHHMAQQQAQLQKLGVQLKRILQQQRKRQALQHWSRLVQYHKQLSAAAAAMCESAGWWWLQHCMARWHCVVAVMAGRRCAELRELVQLRAVLGTWLKYTDQQRNMKATLAAATAALRQHKLRHILRAWQAATEALAAKQELHKVADEQFAQHAKHRMLLQWMVNAAESVLEREHWTVAEQHRDGVRLSLAWRGWSWYCWHQGLKRQVLEYYQSHLLLRVMCGWRNITAAKVAQQVQWLRAVRHCYMTTLHKGVSAWRAALHAAARKQQQLLQAEQQYERQLQLRALLGWQGPFIQHQRRKHERLAFAAAHYKNQRQRQTLRLWQASAAAEAAGRFAVQVAVRHAQAQLQHKAIAAWTQACTEAAAERQQLAAEASPAMMVLALYKQRRVLLAWKCWLQLQHLQHQQVFAAAQHWRHVLLHRGFTFWKQYTAQQHIKAAAKQRADDHRAAKLTAAALSAWGGYVAASRVKRQRHFAAAVYRRSWLAQRTWRAWRFAFAMAKLELAANETAQQSASHVPCSSSSGGSSQPRHLQQSLGQQKPPQLDLDAVAAAVVAASCASQSKWQQQWKQQWQKIGNPLFQNDRQQLPADSHSAEAKRMGADLQYEQQHEANVHNMTPRPQQQPVQHLRRGGQQLSQLQHKQGQLQLMQPCVHADTEFISEPLPDHSNADADALVLQQHICAGGQVSSSKHRRPPRLPAFMQRMQPACSTPHQAYHLPSTLSNCGTVRRLPWPQQQQQHHSTALLQPNSLSTRRQVLQQEQPQHIEQHPGGTTSAGRAGGTLSSCPSAVLEAGRWSTPQVHRARLQPRQLQPSVVGCIPPALQHPQPHQTAKLHSVHKQQLHVGQLGTAQQSMLQPLQQVALQHSIQGIQQHATSHDVQMLVVNHASDAEVHPAVDDYCSTPLAAALAPSDAAQIGISSSLRVVQATPAPAGHVGCASTVQEQQPTVMLAYGASDSSGSSAHCIASELCAEAAVSQVPQPTQSLQQQQTPAARLSSTARVAASPSSRVHYTPMTRQLLQEEVEAMERALQLMTQLKVALQTRQQQATALQAHMMSLSEQLQQLSESGSSANVPAHADTVAGVADAMQWSFEQGELLQQLQEAQQQLEHVEAELTELHAERERQQPRLAAIADRVQQLKAAAAQKQQFQ